MSHRRLKFLSRFVRDTARVLHISPTTVLKELKKRNLRSTR
jgi:hypothetical protein